MSKQLTNNDFFFCYTLELSKYLQQKKIRYILKAKSIKDDNVFTLYQKNDELQEALKEYVAK